MSKQLQILRILQLWTRREIVSRYAGSVGGLLWALIHPLLTIALYYFVFAVVLKVRIPELASEEGYFLYLLAGLLPWLGLADGLAGAAGSLLVNEPLLRKVVFPVGVLPLSSVLAALVPQLTALAVFLVMLAAVGPLSVQGLLWLPVLLGCQLTMTVGLGLMFAVLTFCFRDLQQLIPVMMQFLFYMAPILYPRDFVPQDYQGWLVAHPFAALIDGYHRALLDLPWSGDSRLALVLWTLFLGGGGLIVYRRLRRAMGKWL